MQNQRNCELTFYTQLTFVLIKLSRLLKINCLKEAEISSDFIYSNYISDSAISATSEGVALHRP